MWLPGQVICENYTVVRELGTGATATVYLVRQLDRNVLLAAKCPHDVFAHSAAFRAGLALEAQSWMSLPSHPHIARCHFVRDVEQVPVLFAEYLSEGTLAEWRQERRIRDLGHLIDLSVQICAAMCVAEQLGLVHRDLKPANCLMDKVGRVKVTDFGLTGAISSSQAPRASHDRHSYLLSGTPEYCSPEQLDGKPLDVRSDLWSFGVLLLELLTGRRPAYGPAAPYLLRAHLDGPGPGSVPAELWALVSALLQAEVQARPPSFAAVAEALKGVYWEVTGQQYPREFSGDATISRQNESSEPGLRQRASELLVQVLRAVGRDPAEANRFLPQWSHGTRGDSSDLLGVIAICREIRLIAERETTEANQAQVTPLAIVSETILADTYRRTGDQVAAVQCHTRLIRHVEALKSVQLSAKNRSAMTQAIAGSFTNRAALHRQRGNLHEAVCDYLQAERLLEQLSGHDEPTLDNLRAAIHQNHALALLMSSQIDEAWQQAHRAAEIRQSLVDRIPSRYELDLATTLLNRGVIQRSRGQTRLAIQDYSRCLELAEQPGANGEHVRSPNEVIDQALVNRAAAALSLQDLPLALADCDRAIERLTRRDLKMEGHELTATLAQTFNNRSNARHQLNDLAGALDDIERCIECWERLIQDEGREDLTANLARAFGNKSLYLSELKRFSEAWSYTDRAEKWLESLFQRNQRQDVLIDLVRLKMRQSQVYIGLGQMESALSQSASALQALTRFSSGFQIDIFDLWVATVASHLAQGIEHGKQHEAFARVTHSVRQSAFLSHQIQSHASHVSARISELRLLVAPHAGLTRTAADLLATLDQLMARNNAAQG